MADVCHAQSACETPAKRLGRAFQCMRSGGRVVEGARLESEYTSKAYRGFESLPLRHRIILNAMKPGLPPSGRTSRFDHPESPSPINQPKLQ